MTGRKIDGAKDAARARTARKTLATAVAVGLLMSVAVPAASAADSHWRGTTSTDWSDATNWDAAPAAGSQVFIDALSPHAATLGAGGVEIDVLTVGDQAKGSLTIAGGGTLAVHGSNENFEGVVFGKAAGSEGDVTVSGPGSTLTVDQQTQVGSAGAGSLSVVSGGIANLGLTTDNVETVVGFGYYGQDPGAASGSGTVKVDGAGSTLNYAGGFNLLNGSLTVGDGGQLLSQSRGDSGWEDIIGFGAVASDNGSMVPQVALDGEGAATVTGAGSAWNSVNELMVGMGGKGTLSVLDGGAASFLGAVQVGIEQPTYDYSRDPDTGKTVTTLVGIKEGDGNVEVSGQGASLAVLADTGSSDLGEGDLTVGESSDGTLAVDDKGNVDVVGRLVLGDQAKGELTVSGGGTVSVHGSDADGMGATFGNAVGSEGDATVSGAGSTLTLDAGAQVGNFGSGSLTVHQGGVANIGLATAYSETVAGLGYYGAGGPDAAKGTGTITVDGAGSTLNYAGGMNVLNGSLTASNGGHLVSQSRSGDQGATWLDTIGYGLPADDGIQFKQLTGEATATVTGAGSAWSSVNALDVGNGGTGTLNVLDGGKASFTGWAYLGDAAELYADGTPTGLTQAGTGTVEVSGDGSSLTIAALPGGSAGTDTGLFVGYKGEGTLSVDDKGSADVAGRLTVGDQAKGTLTIAGGGTVSVHGSDDNGQGAMFGNSAGSEGDVSVSGAGSTLTIDAGTQVGRAGAGSLTVQQGAVANLGLATAYAETVVGLGYYGQGDQSVAGGVGTIAVKGAGSTLNYAGGMNLLNGTLSVSDGGQLASRVRDADQGASWLDVIGYGLPSDSATGYSSLVGQGAVTVTGAGSTWKSINALSVGDGGKGTLSVLDGGQASFDYDVVVGDSAMLYDGSGQATGVSQAGTGTVTVSGAGSKLAVSAVAGGGAGSFVVGATGGGTLAVADKGSVDVAGRLTVGDQAKGTLTVSGGGTMAVHGSDADGVGMLTGQAAGSDGEVTVSGAGSSLDVDGGARIGNMGLSAMSVLDGGAVSFQGAVKLGVGDSAITDGQAIESDLLVAGKDSTFSVAAGSGNAGTILVGGSDPEDLGRLTVQDGATVAAAGGIEVGSRGSITIGGYDKDGNVTAPGTVDTPSLKLDASQQTFTLVFQHSAGTESDEYVFAPAISGNGGIDVDSGFTKLTGDSSGYAGHTVVDSGATLSVNGSLGGDIDVSPGGRLQGTGTVDNATIGGTLAPGNSPGTLHVKGNLVMRTGSTYEAQIDPATGQSDSVEVAGNVTIQPGTTLEIQNLGNQPLTPGDQINLIQSTGQGTVQGQFDNTTGDITDFMGYGVTYQDGKVVVGVTRSSTSFASVGDTPQTRALGAALDGVSPDTALGMLLFGQLTSADRAALAFKSMTGTVHADLRRAMLDESRLPRDAVEQRLRQPADTDGTSWWVHALGDWSHADGANGLSGAKADSSGGMMGVDTGVGDDSRLGAAAGLSQTSYRMGGQGSAHLKDRHLALYGRSTAGRLDLGYGLASTWHDVGTNRAFAVGSAPQQLNSDSHARTDQFFVDAGYRFGDSARRYVEPYVALAHVRQHSHAVHEHGSVTALDVDSGSDSATFGTLGVRWSTGAGVARWYGTLGWRHVFGFDRPSVQAQFAEGGSAFTVEGLPMARNAAQVELGASFAVGRRAHVSFGYDGLVAGSASDNGAKAQLTVDL